MNMTIKTISLIGVVILCGAFVMQAKNPFAKSEDAGVKIIEKWDLPDVLKEVSGIASIDDTHFACVQDEVGSIFIYNTATKSIQNEIPFGGPGDYEGITLVNNNVWVLRADGNLFEVETADSKKTGVKEYNTPLTAKQNVEGLCYDKANNRLLLAIKNGEPGGKSYKGVYAFDLASKTMAAEPVFKIESRQNVSGSRKGIVEVMPSAIAIHPKTKDMYITDGRNSILLILSSSGVVKNTFQLSPKDFNQPEGITFQSDGEMYISNEGTKEPGNILKVETGE